ncbi:MFS transporter [Haladaptatus sp. GCM10025707]|uniref:MFS transporter n=1 Tax=unclassified Haladaptatus TaxID=2622732 RepID=UPI0023E77FA6|nr:MULTISPECIES: MFS transporter [unclassified Haladaptatus]
MHPLLRNGPFVRLMTGRLVTNAGDSLYYIAAMWLVYSLTGSAFYTGLAGFLTMLPGAFQFLAGPLVDRVSIRRVLVTTQVIQGVLVLTIPLAHYTGHLTVWFVLTVMPVLASLNQLVYPAQITALPRLVDDEHLVPANSAFSFAYQGVDLVFNAVGGIVVAVFGAVTLFLVDSVTFAAAALLFFSVRVPPAEDADATESPLQTYLTDLREGIAALRASPLFLLILGAVVANFAFGGYFAVLPAYADTLGNSAAYGLLLAALSAGMLAGALGAGTVDHFAFGRLIVVSYLLSGVLWVLAVLAPSLALTAALFAVAAVPIGATNVLVMTLVQTSMPERLVGRVTSVLVSMATVATPFGALLGGAAADASGPTVVMLATGVSFVFVAGYVTALPRLRKLGPIGDVEFAVGAAAD